MRYPPVLQEEESQFIESYCEMIEMHDGSGRMEEGRNKQRKSIWY
jgi:hypothetical protein